MTAARCSATYLVPKAPGPPEDPVIQDDLRRCERDAGHEITVERKGKKVLGTLHRVKVSDRTDLGGIEKIEWI